MGGNYPSHPYFCVEQRPPVVSLSSHAFAPEQTFLKVREDTIESPIKKCYLNLVFTPLTD